MRQLFLICCMLTSSVVTAQTQYVAADRSMETALCISAVSDNKADFQQELKFNRVHIAVAANKLLCNDMPVASFAFQAGNTALYQHLQKYVRGRVDIQDIAVTAHSGKVMVQGR